VRAETVYIGWDVGGWEGKHDGLAVLHWCGASGLQVLGSPVRMSLQEALVGKTLCVGRLLAACGSNVSWERAVIGIDAPLGWPREFVQHVVRPPAGEQAYLPSGPGEINNHLAYRLCDRVVHEWCGKKPMSASFDRLGNNATKAIAGVQLLGENDGALLSPQQGMISRVVATEAYPALWKDGAKKEGQPIEVAAGALSGCELPEPGSDECDAVLAALSAACYDDLTQRHDRGLPVLCLPWDYLGSEQAHLGDEALIADEGWSGRRMDLFPACNCHLGRGR